MASRPDDDEAPPSFTVILLLVVGILAAVSGIKHFDHSNQPTDPHSTIYLVSAQ